MDLTVDVPQAAAKSLVEERPSEIEAPQPALLEAGPPSPSSSPSSSTTLAPALRRFAAVQIALTIACFAAEACAKLLMHLSGPYIYPLKTRSQTAWDFVLFNGKFQHFGRPDFFQTDPEIPFPYPAPLAVAYKAFFSYQAHPLRLFLAFSLAAFAVAAAVLCRALHRRGVSWGNASAFVLTALLLAYPLWFELKQGNIEICVWVLVTLGVWAFCKDRPAAAAVCFGVAGSMKVFPFVFLGLLLAVRRYRETALAALAAVVSTIASLWLVGPGISNTWRSVENGVSTFRAIYILNLRPEETGFDHSLFGVYKRLYHPLPPPLAMGHVETIYVAAAAIFGIALYFLKIRRLPLINQVLCLAVASILLPPISFDYTLMYLYLPWAMLALLAQQQWNAQYREQPLPAWSAHAAPQRNRAGNDVEKTIPGLSAALVCLAILVSPESEFIWHEAHLGGQIKALVLLALLGIGLMYPFQEQSLSS
jgi:hypothetical protein